MERQARPTSTPETLPADFKLYNRSLLDGSEEAGEIVITRPNAEINIDIPLLKPGEKPKRYSYNGARWTEHRVTVTHTDADEDKNLKGKQFFVYLR